MDWMDLIVSIIKMLSALGILPEDAATSASSVIGAATDTAATVSDSGLPLWAWASIGIGALIILAVIALLSLRFTVRLIARELRGSNV